MNTQQILTTVANAPHDAEAVIDIAGNGVDLIPVTACEVRGGLLVVIGSKKRGQPSPATANAQGLDQDVKYRQAVGMLTTIKPDLVMNPDDPLAMAREVVEYVANLRAANDALKGKPPKKQRGAPQPATPPVPPVATPQADDLTLEDTP